MSEGSKGEGLVNEVLNGKFFRNGYLRNIPFMFQPLKTLKPLILRPRFGPWDIPDTWDTIIKPGSLVEGNHHWFFRREEYHLPKGVSPFF